MNDLEAAHSVEPAPTSRPSPEEAIAAPITVYGRRETDESYEGVIARDGDLRIVNCPDDIQPAGNGVTSHSIARVTL